MKLFPRMATDTEMVDTDAALSEEVMKMTTEDLIARTRLLDNDCKIMRSGFDGGFGFRRGKNIV